MTTQPEDATSDSPLHALAKQFAQWRASRANRRVPVPDSLRQQALDLMNDYRLSHIIKALGINSTMLKTWQEQNIAPEQSAVFVALNANTPSVEPAVALTLTYSQGPVLQVKGNFSLAQLTAFAQGLCPVPAQAE